MCPQGVQLREWRGSRPAAVRAGEGGRGAAATVGGETGPGAPRGLAGQGGKVVTAPASLPCSPGWCPAVADTQRTPGQGISPSFVSKATTQPRRARSGVGSGAGSPVGFCPRSGPTVCAGNRRMKPQLGNTCPQVFAWNLSPNLGRGEHVLVSIQSHF